MTAPAGYGLTSPRTRLRMIERLRAQGITDEKVLSVMAQVPRHAFIDAHLASRAYDDVALPIGLGQTISQPYTVARMSELAMRSPNQQKVLEIGTGCGYQTAVLAQLFKEVYSVERILSLQTKARQHLREQNIRNVRLKHADGHLGLLEAAPYDVILMTAAASHMPNELIMQLVEGGHLIMPLGESNQALWVFIRKGDEVEKTQIEPVKFVPLLPGTL